MSAWPADRARACDVRTPIGVFAHSHAPTLAPFARFRTVSHASHGEVRTSESRVRTATPTNPDLPTTTHRKRPCLSHF